MMIKNHHDNFNMQSSDNNLLKGIVNHINDFTVEAGITTIEAYETLTKAENSTDIVITPTPFFEELYQHDTFEKLNIGDKQVLLDEDKGKYILSPESFCNEVIQYVYDRIRTLYISIGEGCRDVLSKLRETNPIDTCVWSTLEMSEDETTADVEMSIKFNPRLDKVVFIDCRKDSQADQAEIIRRVCQKMGIVFEIMRIDNVNELH